MDWIPVGSDGATCAGGLGAVLYWVREATSSPSLDAATRVSEFIGSLARCPVTRGTAGNLSEILTNLGPLCRRFPGVLGAASPPVRDMLIAAIRYEPPQHLAPFSGRPGPLERLAAIAAEQTLGCVPELPTIPRDTLAVLQEGCRRISDVADPRAHGGVLQPLLSLVASTATHMLVCRASRSDFGASEDILLRPLELAHSILETQLENMRDGNLPSPSETKLAAAAAEAAGALMAALAAMGSATLSTRAWVRGVLGEPKSDPVVALVTLFSGVASKCMEVLPGAPGIAPLASSAIRAMGIMGHACVHRGLPLPVVGAEIRSLLSEAAARLGPSSVSGRAMGTGETQREWWWLQALMPDSGAVLACGGWCGIRRPDGLRHTAAAWWEVCRSVVTAASRGIAAFHVSGSTEAAMSSVLTVAAGLADVSGVGRSGWEAQGWGALLSEVGQTLADLGAYPLVSSLVGLLMDALAEVDTPPQKDDVAASSCALAAVVVGVVARARREAKESDRALEMLEKAVDVLSSAYVSPAMGAARRGVAMGLAHLGHGVRAHGFPDAIELLATKLLRTVQDVLWDSAVSLPGAQLVTAKQRGCMGEPPARRHLTGDDILALLPALSTVLSVWLGRGQEALWDDIEDLDALPEIAEGHAPAVHVIHAISVLGSQPGAYQDALEALDRPGVVQLIRQLQMTWFGLAVAGAEKGLAGVPGPVLGLTDLAAVTPALVLKPGYQRDEARMDMRILLERMFGTTQLTSVLIRSRSGPQSSAFHNVRARSAAKKMDARDVAIMTAIDLANACRIEMIDAGTHPPSVAVLAASMSQLHMSDRSEVPVCEIMLRSTIRAFVASLSARHKEKVGSGVLQSEILSPSFEMRSAAKGAALLLISQLQDRSTAGTTGEETTAPPPEQSAVAVVRSTAERVAQEMLMDVVNAYPAVMYSQGCLGALLQMSVDADGLITSSFKRLFLRQLHRITKVFRSKTAQQLLFDWVKNSALYAPSAMESSVHQMLVSYASGSGVVESAELMRHASQVLDICTQARRRAAVRNPTGLFTGTASEVPSSFTLLNTKAMYLGRAHGSLFELAAVLGTREKALLQLIETACGRLEEREQDTSVLAEDVMVLAALLSLASREDLTYSLSRQLLLRAVRALVRAPTAQLDRGHVAGGVLAWSWVCSAIPKLVQVDVVAEVAGFLSETAATRKGIFASDDASSPDDTLHEVVRGQQACISFLMEHLGIHYKECTPAAEAVRTAILHMCSACIPAFLASATGYPEPRPAATVHGRLQLLLLMVDATKDSIGLDADKRKVLMATSALRQISQATVAVFSESAAAWCSLWLGMEIHAHISIVLQLANALTSLGNRVVSLSKVMAFASQHVSQALKEQDLAVLLCQVEADRLRLWLNPVGVSDLESEATSDLRMMAISAKPLSIRKIPARKTHMYVDTAWELSPTVAVRLMQQNPAARVLVARVLHHIKHDLKRHGCDKLSGVPIAAPLVLQSQDVIGVTDEDISSLFRQLPPASLREAMQMLASGGERLYVREYAVRCLKTESPAQIMFYMPQMVQTLRHESDGLDHKSRGPVTHFLVEASRASDTFAHRIFWMLRSEGTPPDEAMDPEIKRSGWKPPVDSGLWRTADRVRDHIVGCLGVKSKSYLELEDSFFGDINQLSEKMKDIPSTMRKQSLRDMLKEVNAKYVTHLDNSARVAAGKRSSHPPIYMPIDPKKIVLRAVTSKGNVMPSAAKFPVMVFFDTAEPSLPRSWGASAASCQMEQAYIFKVGDDVRQDVLALQVIELLRNAFGKAGLDVNLFPYGTIPTGFEQGIIEVVPDCQSRSALGEVSDGGLYDIFMREYGAPGSPIFETARLNFLRSAAGYAVACYILQAKDRHNGNILIRKDGSMVHIDFGFILEISPGGNMGFETAAFKLSHDMTQLIDPGRKKKSTQFHMFVDLCVRGFLIARSVAEDIIAVVGLMQHSGLPCFGHGKPMENLRKRFRLDLSNRQAAKYFRKVVYDSYNKWSTKYYDIIQLLQNQYPH